MEIYMDKYVRQSIYNVVKHESLRAPAQWQPSGQARSFSYTHIMLTSCNTGSGDNLDEMVRYQSQNCKPSLSCPRGDTWQASLLIVWQHQMYTIKYDAVLTKTQRHIAQYATWHNVHVTWWPFWRSHGSRSLLTAAYSAFLFILHTSSCILLLASLLCIQRFQLTKVSLRHHQYWKTRTQRDSASVHVHEKLTKVSLGTLWLSV